MEKNSDSKLPKSELTKIRIVESFLTLIENKRWDKISVKDICTESNITRTTFYQYYENIFDVMEKIQETHLTALEKISETCCQSVTSSPIASLDELETSTNNNLASAMDRSWYTYCSEHRLDFLALCHPANGDEYFKKKLKTLWCHYINISMDQDGFPNDNFRKQFLDLIFNNFFQSMYSFLSTDSETPLSIDELCYIQSAWRIGTTYLRLKGDPKK